MIILADWLVTSAREEPQRGWGLRVTDGRIDAAGPGDELVAAHPDDEIHDAQGQVVLPGFVNAHLHAYGVLAHGIPLEKAPSGFWSFLADFWWPLVEDVLDHEMIAVATDWACTELLLSGTTSFFDVLEAPQALPEALLVQQQVVERRGIRAVLSFEATERAGPEVAELGLQENARLIEACRNSDLVAGAVSFHTTFTCSPDYIKRAFALAEERDVMCHAHCNEGVHEPERALEAHGMRTMELYEDLGVASPRFLASQCVQLSDREREIIAERGVRCAHMPLSNGEVGAGIAPVPELLGAGVTLGLGSDGYVNDMYEVMRAAFLLHKARLLDPTTMPAATVLDMATAGSARATGLEGLGELRPGSPADLQVVDAQFPTPTAGHNLLDQIVLWRSGTHVRDVMVAGEWRVLDREVLGVDVGQQRHRVHEQARRLWPT